MIHSYWGKMGEGMSLLSPFNRSRRNGVLFSSVFFFDSGSFGGHGSGLHAESRLNRFVNFSVEFPMHGLLRNSLLSAHAVCSIGRNNFDGLCFRASRFAVAVAAFVDRLRDSAAANQCDGDCDSNLHVVVLHNWPAQAYYNRKAFVTLAAELAMLPVRPAKAQAERASQAAKGSFAAFIEALVLSVLAPQEVRA